MRDSSTGKVGSRTYYFLLTPRPDPVAARNDPASPTRLLGSVASVSDQDMPPPEELGETIPQSPHSARAIVLRILAALLVAAAAFALQSLWLDEGSSRETFGAKVKSIEVDSSLLDRTMPVRVVVPRRIPDKGRGLLVFLHGRGEDERSYLVDPMFEALADLRDRAPVVAFPYGGASSYWHNRDSGQWAAYVLSELIPRLIRRFDIAPRKIAIGGISMGGFGAYDIARLSPHRFCAIGGHSPAIWENAGETADGAFDDAADFERNDIIAAAKLYAEPLPGHPPVDRRRQRRPVPRRRSGLRGCAPGERPRSGRPRRPRRPRLRLLERQLARVPRLLRPRAQPLQAEHADDRRPQPDRRRGGRRAVTLTAPPRRPGAAGTQRG